MVEPTPGLSARYVRNEFFCFDGHVCYGLRQHHNSISVCSDQNPSGLSPAMNFSSVYHGGIGAVRGQQLAGGEEYLSSSPGPLDPSGRATLISATEWGISWVAVTHPQVHATRDACNTCTPDAWRSRSPQVAEYSWAGYSASSFRCLAGPSGFTDTRPVRTANLLPRASVAARATVPQRRHPRPGRENEWHALGKMRRRLQPRILVLGETRGAHWGYDEKSGEEVRRKHTISAKWPANAIDWLVRGPGVMNDPGRWQNIGAGSMFRGLLARMAVGTVCGPVTPRSVTFIQMGLWMIAVRSSFFMSQPPEMAVFGD